MTDVLHGASSRVRNRFDVSEVTICSKCHRVVPLQGVTGHVRKRHGGSSDRRKHFKRKNRTRNQREGGRNEQEAWSGQE